jgi:hypothetical protein
MASVRLKPDEHGNLLIPKEALGDAPPDAVYTLEREGRVIRLEPAPRKLNEIEDPEERVRVFREFLRDFAKPGGGDLPEWHVIRDDIYD